MPPIRRFNSARRGRRYIPRGLRYKRPLISTDMWSVSNRFSGKKKSFSSGNGVTSQFDRTLQYRRKSAPKRIKRRARKQRRTHEWNLIKDLGSQTFVRNSTLQGGWAAGVTTQYAVNCCIYGMRGAATDVNNAGFTDVFDICAADANVNSASNNQKLLFSTAILDVTYTNASDAGFVQEVDVYEIIFTGRNSGGSVLQDYNEAFTDTPKHAVGGATITSFSPRGVTPFECPLASARGYKVLKKTKYFVAPGNCFTYRIKDKRNKWLHMTDLRNDSSAFEGQWRYKTRNLLFISKPIAGTDVALAGEFFIGCTRKYMYKVIQDNKDVTTSI